MSEIESICEGDLCYNPLLYYSAEVVSANDYYPGGMIMPGRKYAATSKYRYGFNGKENDNDVKGEGNQQDYGMRIYDPRLGRFLSVDPITNDYPELTPYQFASNNPIQNIDLDGLEGLAGNLMHPGKYHVAGDANDDGIVDKSERDSWGKMMALNAKVAIYGLISFFRPDVAIPMIVSDISGVPVTPAPQAMAGSAATQAVNKTEVAMSEASTETAVATSGTSGSSITRGTKTTVIKNANSQTAAANGSPNAAAANTALQRGSGSTSGVIELNANVKSVQAFKNSISKVAKDFVYDPTTQKFALAGEKVKGIRHFGLRRIIGATEANVVGGRIKLGPNGEVLTSQWSGTYGKNWTSEISKRFEEFMKNVGKTKVNHSNTEKFTDGTQ